MIASRRRRQILLLFAASILLIFVPAGIWTAVRLRMAGRLRPATEYSADKAAELRRRVHLGRGRMELATECEHLERENSRLLAILRGREDELARLRRDLGELGDLARRSEPARSQMIRARIIREALDWNRTTVVIDRGRLHGVEKGAGVLSGLAVIGRVVDVDEEASLVALLTDPRCCVLVRVVGPEGRAPASGAEAQQPPRPAQAKGIVHGAGSRLCKLEFVSVNYAIQEDEDVVTSDLGGYFPDGLPVGKITQIEPPNEGEMMYRAWVTPAVDLWNLGGLTVLKPSPQKYPQEWKSQ